jgi:VanZ like family
MKRVRRTARCSPLLGEAETGSARKAKRLALPYEQGTKPTRARLIEPNGESAIVMQSQATQPHLRPDSQEWSNRILIVAIAGILFLTCFPFRFMSHARLPNGVVSPVFLGKTFGKHPGIFDDFLNVLLFIPLGFGLSETLLEKGRSRISTFFAVWIAGFFLSYAIEFTQLYIPGRDSGWEDVITNSSGSAVGFFLFIVLGSFLLRLLYQTERALESFATVSGLAAALLIYFSCWFAVSARLQAQTKLADWHLDSYLLIGNDASGKTAALWNGQLSELEMWNQPLSAKTAAALTGGTEPPGGAPKPIVAYDLGNGPSLGDGMKSPPDLSWSLGVQGHGDPSHLVLDDGKSLALTTPASGLVADLRRTNQFALHVVCKPAEGDGSYAQIVSISHVPTVANLTMRQEGASLVFWFRNPLSARHAQLAWYVPHVFAANQSRNILYSYDGSNLLLYIDGKAAALPYRLGPGAVLAHAIRRIKPNELDGYHDIYYALVFFPAGIALGIFARAARGRRMAAWLFIAPWLIVPPLLLEYLLIAVSGRTFSPGNLVLSVGLLVFGALWINADNTSHRRTSAG